MAVLTEYALPATTPCGDLITLICPMCGEHHTSNSSVLFGRGKVGGKLYLPAVVPHHQTVTVEQPCRSRHTLNLRSAHKCITFI